MSPYDAPHDLEELQLLRQLRRAPVQLVHSATATIGERLALSGDAMIIGGVDEPPLSRWLTATTKGNGRLMEARIAETGAPRRCPFCDSRPVPSPGGALLMHPRLSRCILRDFATGDLDGWNMRIGAFGNG